MENQPRELEAGKRALFLATIRGFTLLLGLTGIALVVIGVLDKFKK